MNISQALRRANILKGRISDWETRSRVSNVLNHSRRVPTNDKDEQEEFKVENEPVYSFEECEKGRNEARDELLRLSAACAEANASNYVTFKDEKFSLAEALRRLSNMKSEIAWLGRIGTLPQKEVLSTRQKKVWDVKEQRWDYVDESFKQTCTLAARDIQRRSDALQESFDELNNLVESANGGTQITLGKPAA